MNTDSIFSLFTLFYFVYFGRWKWSLNSEILHFINTNLATKSDSEDGPTGNELNSRRLLLPFFPGITCYSSSWEQKVLVGWKVTMSSSWGQKDFKFCSGFIRTQNRGNMRWIFFFSFTASVLASPFLKAWAEKTSSASSCDVPPSGETGTHWQTDRHRQTPAEETC